MLPAIRQKILFEDLSRCQNFASQSRLRRCRFSSAFIAFSNEKKFFQQAAARKSFRPIENTFQNCLACVSVLKSFFYARAASSTFTSSESLPVIKSPSGGGTSPLPPPAPCGRSLKDAAYCAPSETQFPVSENVRIPPPAPSHAPEK